MGSTVSVGVKAVLAILLSLAEKHEIALKEKGALDLLQWGQRRNILTTMDEVFKEDCWQALGKDLWESVQVENKEAVTLSHVWYLINQLMKKTRVESEIMEAAERALGYSLREKVKKSEQASISSPDPVVLPANVRDAKSIFETPLPPDYFSPEETGAEAGMESAALTAPPISEDEIMEQENSPLEELQQIKREEEELKKQASALQLEGHRQKIALGQLGTRLREVMRQQSGLLQNLYQQLQRQSVTGFKSTSMQDEKTQTVDAGQKWHGIIRDAAIEGEFLGPLKAFPVHLHHNAAGAEVREWQQFDWQLLDRLQKATMQYGLDNTYVRNLIDVVFSQNILTPFDIETLVSLILSPMQKLVFKDDWRKRCELAVMKNLDLQDGDPLKFATLDMLMGQGAFVHPRAQARLDRRILQQSQSLAAVALKALQVSATASPPYVKILQLPSESFSTFLDRLRTAIEKSPNLSTEAKSAVMLDLAVQNANDVCKRILSTLPKTAGLVQMMEACARADLVVEQDKAVVYAQAQAKALAAALQPVLKPRNTPQHFAWSQT